jgi:signal-transduction protein with cAMP-binding, CBS, and nucleotidyltransferase domain
MGVTASAISPWIVPAVLAILVLAAAWVGVRWYNSEYSATLGHVPLLSKLSPRQLRSVARSAARQDVGPGARLVTEGERSDGFFVIEKGSVGVTVRGDRVATLGPGGYFGEMAVIDRGRRSGTIEADMPTTVLHLPSSQLRALLLRDPTIGDAMAGELEQRLRDAGAPVPPEAAGAPGIERLEILSRELRTVRHVDWGAPSGSRVPRSSPS